MLNYQEAKESLSLRKKVGQLFMPAAFINDTEEEMQRLELLIQEQGIGALCFFHSRASAATNYEEDPTAGQAEKKVIYNENSFDTLKALIQRYQAAAKYPLLIAIDAEWGLAMRVENTPQYPYAITLGAIQGNTDLVFEVGRNIARDCKAAGIHWNLAPVADINNNPNNPVIGYRSFGEQRDLVTKNAIAYVKGTQSEGVLTSVKHFPGHGDTATDSHLGLPLIEKSKQELLSNELHPFQKLVDEDIDSVMVGHLSVPQLANGSTISSSISKEIIKEFLRGEMGYKGVVISDALNMHAVSKNYSRKGELEWLAFDAGNDILCFAEHIPEGIATIANIATKSQIEESFERIWKLKERAFKDKAEADLKLFDPSQLNTKIALQSLSLVKGTESDISDFRSEDFTGIVLSGSIENHFFKEINKKTKFSAFSIKSDMEDTCDNVLIALFPPQIKPVDRFGYSKEEIDWINELIRTRNVVLYLFGNPYVLNLINIIKAKVVVVAYQNFDTFQKAAASHFLGTIKAKGKLPVTIESI